MKVTQMYTGCLAHAAYYIESNGEAAVFDPLREAQPYIEKAAGDKARIKYVFLTHFHADFVSGHTDLAQKTGAQIVLGPTAKPAYKAVIATDGQVFTVGHCTVQALHTPGHTLESTTYLLTDEHGKAHGIITGDTLFIGDVGRPDLAQHVVPGLTPELLAGHLYDSLHNKILPLPDHLVVYPNHGAGSACGKMMSDETTDTLGHQKQVNYALDPTLTKEAFIKAVLDGLTTPPAYFPKNVLLNMQGAQSLDTVMTRGKKALQPVLFEALANETGALVLDTRDSSEFAKGFIPNSINIGLYGSFAQWVGEMLPDIEQPILLVTDSGTEEEAITRLSRVGYDGTIGFLAGGFENWLQTDRDIDSITRIDAHEFARRYREEEPLVLDVRKKSEYDTQHVAGAVNIPLNELNQRLAEIPRHKPFILYCAGGYRSMLAASILKQRGWNNFVDVEGGLREITQTTVPKTAYVYPTTLL